MQTAQRYIQLAHAIEAHFPGYIDAYFGPPEWKQVSKRPLRELIQEATDLFGQVQSLPPGRREWLSAQVKSMQTVIAVLASEPISYRDEVRGTHDIDPIQVPESRFEEAGKALEQLLPGTGSLNERLNEFRKQFIVPPEKIKALLAFALERLAARVRQQYGLPAGESFDIELVNNKHWGAYNWYLGNYRSRIDLNTDLPTYLNILPDYMAHEGYPGHHTEHVFKEQHLSRDKGYVESQIILLNSPESVISEGIAVKALEMVLSKAEVEVLLLELAQKAQMKIGKAEIAAICEIDRQSKALRYLEGNAALLLHQEKKSEAEVIGYLQQYGLSTPERAHKILEFITHPSSRSYVFTYSVGGDLLDALFVKGDAQTWYRRLLKEAITPGMLRGWITAA